MNLFSEIREILRGLYSLAVGMKITGIYFFQPKITIHYPRQTVDNLSTYFGHIELVPSEDNPQEPACIACGLCAKNCPSGCITLEAAKTQEEPLAPGEKKKKARKKPGAFFLDYSLCSLCGLCVENCPSNALRFSTHVYWAEMKKENITNMDLLARFNGQNKAA